MDITSILSGYDLSNLTIGVLGGHSAHMHAGLVVARLVQPGSRIEAGAGDLQLQPGDWHHIAGVYDGSETRLYVDGKLRGTVQRSGERTTNRLPLVIGGDVNGNGEPVSAFDGELDEVRLSIGAVYEADFQPLRRLDAGGGTLLLLHMDGAQGPYLFDSSDSSAHATMAGKAEIVEPD